MLRVPPDLGDSSSEDEGDDVVGPAFIMAAQCVSAIVRRHAKKQTGRHAQVVPPSKSTAVHYSHGARKPGGGAAACLIPSRAT